jgi:hypothetical protein
MTDKSRRNFQKVRILSNHELYVQLSTAVREVTASFQQQPKEFYAAGFQGFVK